METRRRGWKFFSLEVQQHSSVEELWREHDRIKLKLKYTARANNEDDVDDQTEQSGDEMTVV